MEDFFNQVACWLIPISCVLVPIALLVLYLYVSDQSKKEKEKKIRIAYDNYAENYKVLKNSPTDADQRQRTLIAGREYARLLREDKKETVFDEIALMNDLNAIAGSQVDTETKPKVETKEEKSIEERLRILDDLREKSLVSEEEYQKRKDDILSQI